MFEGDRKGVRMNERRIEAVDDVADPVEAPRTLGEIGLQNFAPYLMNRIMGRYNQSLREVLAKAGLTTPKMRTLAVLSVLDGLMMNELSVYAVIEQSTLSRTLDGMEAEGLIRRESGVSDNRVRHIYLTNEGRALFETIWPYLGDAHQAMFAGISQDEHNQFVMTLQKILRNVRKHDF